MSNNEETTELQIINMSANKSYKEGKTVGTQTSIGSVESSDTNNEKENENSSQIYWNKVKLVMALIPTTLDHVSDVLGNFHSYSLWHFSPTCFIQSLLYLKLSPFTSHSMCSMCF